MREPSRRMSRPARGTGTRLVLGPSIVLFGGLLSGCASLPGSVITAPAPTATIGDGAVREARIERYAFARARVPITISGRSVPSTRPATGPAQHRQTLTMEIGSPKYAVDAAVRTRIALAPDDAFRLEVDDRRLLRSVAAIPAPAPSVPRSGLADVEAELTRRRPPGPASVVVTRTTATTLADFRHEAEVDPSSAAEIAALQAELDRIARGWGLSFSFSAVPTDATIQGRTITLAPVRTVHCTEPVCFRVPIPYRIAVATTGPAWRGGKLESVVWLPNDGPIGSLDVRSGAFSAGGLEATFSNGMLRAIVATDAGQIPSVMRIPAETPTASIGR